MTNYALERHCTLCRQAGWLARVSSPVRSAPARCTREQLDGMDRIERRGYDKQRAVWHANLGPIFTPQMQTVFAELDEIVGSNRQDGDRVRGAAVPSALPGSGKSTIAVCYGGGLPPRAGRGARRAHRRRSPPGPGRLPRADVEHNDAQPELRALPLLRSSRLDEGQREPARRPRDRLRAVLPNAADHDRRSPRTVLVAWCRIRITGTDQLTVELLDQIRNDEAAEQARRELATAFERGLLTTRTPATTAREARAA